MNKPRHVSVIGGKFYYRATHKMRNSGIHNEPLGEDKSAAFSRAEFLNEEWDRIKHYEPPKADIAQFTELCRRFQADPVWYAPLATATKDDIDRAFALIIEAFGDAPVSLIETKHVRNLYNRLRVENSAAKARKTHKWLRRLFRYSIEIGLREYNPAIQMRVEADNTRTAVWTPRQVEALIIDAQTGGRTATNNFIPPRLSVALATRIAYDTAQRQGDILALTWTQYDGEGIEVTQQKTGKKLWLPLSADTIAMLDKTNRISTHVIISELTGQPYTKNTFSRIFRKFRQRAGIEGVHFHDLRRTVATELGNRGATSAEIVSITGHSLGSKIIDTYVRPDREAALRAVKKREDD